MKVSQFTRAQCLKQRWAWVWYIDGLGWVGSQFFVFYSVLDWVGFQRQCEMGCGLTRDISVSQLTVALLLATLRLLPVVKCVKYQNARTHKRKIV